MTDEDRELYAKLGISRWAVFKAQTWAIWQTTKWILFTQWWCHVLKWYHTKIAGKAWPPASKKAKKAGK